MLSLLEKRKSKSVVSVLEQEFHMKKKSVPSSNLVIQRTFLFEKTLYLFRSVLIPENSAFALALGTMIFLQLEDDAFLETLYRHLDGELIAFANDPRDQPDLENSLYKLLAYHGLCLKKGYIDQFPADIFGTYLNFAEKEQWLDSAVLALFATYFANDMQATASIPATFRGDLKSIIRKESLTRICQTVLILGGQIPDADISFILEMVKTERITANDLPWIVLGLNSIFRNTQYEILKVKCAIDTLVTQYIERMEDSVINNQDGMILEGLTNTLRYKKTFENLKLPENTILDTIVLEDERLIIKLRENFITSMFSAELGLCLWVLTETGRNQMIGLTMESKEYLIHVLEDYKRFAEKENILIDRKISIFINLLALLFILSVGLTYSLYYGGVSLDFENYQARESLPILVATLLLFVLGFISLVKTGTIISVLFENNIVKSIFQGFSQWVRRR